MAESPPTRRHLKIEISSRTIMLVFGVLAAVWLVEQLTTVFTMITVALVLVGTFDPGVAWLEKRGLRRGRALVLVFGGASLAIVGLIVLMVPPLVTQLLDLVTNAPQVRARVLESLQGHDWAKSLSKAIENLPLEDAGAKVGEWAISYSTDLLEFIGYALSTLFLAIYMLADPARSKGLLFSLVPRQHHVKLARILIELKVIVGGYMRGQLITSLSISAFVFALLTILGADNALAIALFAGLTNVIPIVGSYLASAPVILAVAPQGATTIIIVTVLLVIYQEFENRVLLPRVYGRVLRLAPAIVLVALIAGGLLAGIFGALLALPIAAGLQMVIRELHVDLPGEVAHAETVRQLDEKAVEVYEQLADGATAVEAAQIADNLAVIVKQTEAQVLVKVTPEAAPEAAPDEPTTPLVAKVGEPKPA